VRHLIRGGEFVKDFVQRILLRQGVTSQDQHGDSTHGQWPMAGSGGGRQSKVGAGRLGFQSLAQMGNDLKFFFSRIRLLVAHRESGVLP